MLAAAAVNAATARANKTAILFIFIAFSLLLVDPLTPWRVLYGNKAA
jgi:hypothetical protein